MINQYCQCVMTTLLIKYRGNYKQTIVGLWYRVLSSMQQTLLNMTILPFNTCPSVFHLLSPAVCFLWSHGRWWRFLLAPGKLDSHLRHSHTRRLSPCFLLPDPLTSENDPGVERSLIKLNAGWIGSTATQSLLQLRFWWPGYDISQNLNLIPRQS